MELSVGDAVCYERFLAIVIHVCPTDECEIAIPDEWVPMVFAHALTAAGSHFHSLNTDISSGDQWTGWDDIASVERLGRTVVRVVDAVG